MSIKYITTACVGVILFVQLIFPLGRSFVLSHEKNHGCTKKCEKLQQEYSNENGINNFKNNSCFELFSKQLLFKESYNLSSNFNNIFNIKYYGKTHLNSEIMSIDYSKLKLNETSQSRQDIDNAILISSKKYGIDPILISSLIKQESNFNPNCRSHVGAIGVMQIMPNTINKFGVNDPYDVYQNIDAGTRHLRGMIDRYSGDIVKGVAAYNLGGYALDKSGFETLEDISMLPKETRIHVTKIFDYYNNGF